MNLNDFKKTKLWNEHLDEDTKTAIEIFSELMESDEPTVELVDKIYDNIEALKTRQYIIHNYASILDYPFEKIKVFDDLYRLIILTSIKPHDNIYGPFGVAPFGVNTGYTEKPDIPFNPFIAADKKMMSEFCEGEDVNEDKE